MICELEPLFDVTAQQISSFTAVEGAEAALLLFQAARPGHASPGIWLAGQQPCCNRTSLQR
jgi:hypothetical protein